MKILKKIFRLQNFFPLAKILINLKILSFRLLCFDVKTSKKLFSQKFSSSSHFLSDLRARADSEGQERNERSLCDGSSGKSEETHANDAARIESSVE